MLGLQSFVTSASMHVIIMLYSLPPFIILFCPPPHWFFTTNLTFLFVLSTPMMHIPFFLWLHSFSHLLLIDISQNCTCNPDLSINSSSCIFLLPGGHFHVLFVIIPLSSQVEVKSFSWELLSHFPPCFCHWPEPLLSFGSLRPSHY